HPAADAATPVCPPAGASACSPRLQGRAAAGVLAPPPRRRKRGGPKKNRGRQFRRPLQSSPAYWHGPSSPNVPARVSAFRAANLNKRSDRGPPIAAVPPHPETGSRGLTSLKRQHDVRIPL